MSDRCEYCGRRLEMGTFCIACTTCALVDDVSQLKRRVKRLETLLRDAHEYVRSEPIYRNAAEGPNKFLDEQAAELNTKIEHELNTK